MDGLSKDTEVEAELVLYDAAENVISQSQLSNNLGSEGITVDVEVLQKRAFRYSSVCQESRQRDIVIRDAPVNLPVSRSVEKYGSCECNGDHSSGFGNEHTGSY